MLSNRNVSVLYCHQVPFVPAIGQLKNTLNADGDHKGMEMTYTPEGVVCSYKGQHFIIPLANVANAVFRGPVTWSGVTAAPKAATKPEAKAS